MLQVVMTSESNNGSTSAPWSPSRSIGFRFLFAYLALSTWFWIFEFSDRSTALLGRPYIALWRPMVQWVAAHILGWSPPIELNFVHDTRYLYAQVACFLIVSAIVSLAWSIVDGLQGRGQAIYRQLYGWMRLFLRYTLAYLMLHYGMDKVFLIQFPAPGLARLLEPLGQYSPSSLMWAFIGSSVPYTVFGGLTEIAGALFLLTRKTTLLGALVVFAVMLNVTVMDFSYDVSVKLFCLHLLLMAGFLIMPDASRLLDLFLLNRDTRASGTDVLIIPQSKKLIVMTLKIIVVVILIVPLMVRDWKSNRNARQAGRDKNAAIYGLYDVTEFTMNGEVHPPLLTDASRWRVVVIESPSVLTVEHMDESISIYPMAYDAAAHQLHILGSGGSQSGLLTIGQVAPEQASFVGNVDGASIHAVMHRVDRNSFPVVNRGFHWINESSFIR